MNWRLDESEICRLSIWLKHRAVLDQCWQRQATGTSHLPVETWRQKSLNSTSLSATTAIAFAITVNDDIRNWVSVCVRHGVKRHLPLEMPVLL